MMVLTRLYTSCLSLVRAGWEGERATLPQCGLQTGCSSGDCTRGVSFFCEELLLLR